MNISHGLLSNSEATQSAFSEASNVRRWPWHETQRLDQSQQVVSLKKMTLHMDQRFLYLICVKDVQLMKHAVYALLWTYHHLTQMEVS